MIAVVVHDQADEDLGRFVRDADDIERILDWIGERLAVYPHVGTALKPPHTASRQWVLDRKWRLIWEVEYDQDGHPLRVVLQRGDSGTTCTLAAMATLKDSLT